MSEFHNAGCLPVDLINVRTGDMSHSCIHSLTHLVNISWLSTLSQALCQTLRIQTWDERQGRNVKGYRQEEQGLWGFWTARWQRLVQESAQGPQQTGLCWAGYERKGTRVPAAGRLCVCRLGFCETTKHTVSPIQKQADSKRERQWQPLLPAGVHIFLPATVHSPPSWLCLCYYIYNSSLLNRPSSRCFPLTNPDHEGGSKSVWGLRAAIWQGGS